jgi:hypothetical protein
MAEMDRDNCRSCNFWPVGGEDWLWQEVGAPPHSSVTLTLTESHHMHSGSAEIRIYGSVDASNWTLVWERLEPDAAFGAGKDCLNGDTPQTFSYTISASYPYYRLEAYGRMNEEEDAWILGPLLLTVQ